MGLDAHGRSGLALSKFLTALGLLCTSYGIGNCVFQWSVSHITESSACSLGNLCDAPSPKELSRCLAHQSFPAFTVQKASSTFAFAQGPSFSSAYIADSLALTFDSEAIDFPKLIYWGGAFCASQLAQQLAEDIRGFRPHVAGVHDSVAPHVTTRSSEPCSSCETWSQDLPATILDGPLDETPQSPLREKRRDDPLDLPLAAQSKKNKKSGSSQPRWAFRSKSDTELDTIAMQLHALNALPDRQGKHVVLLCKDGAVIGACADPHTLREAIPASGIMHKRQVSGLALGCARCGVVSPLNEKVQFCARLCRKAKSLAPQSDVSKMAEDLRLVLSYEMSRGSSLSESHLASVRALALQCQQVLSDRTASLSSHSGGQISIASFNVGGLRQKLEGVIDLDFDLVAIQEVGAARFHSESLRRLAMKQDWQLSFGPTPLSYRDAMGRKRTNPSLGVATLTRSTNGLSNMDHDFEPLPTLGPRLSSWFFIQGHFECYIHVIYGSTCAEEDWADSNMDLIAALRSRISQKRGIAQMVLGDFQTDIRSQLAMRDLFHDGWLSSTCLAEAMHTNISATGVDRILDDILLSPEVAQRFVSMDIKFLAGFSTHGCIVVKLDPGVAPDRSGWRLPKPCMSDDANWGKVAHENGLSHELWWKEQLQLCPRESTQAMYDFWLSCFNSWLDITNPNDETYALRGRCGSYFTSELGGKGTSAIQGAAWKIHVLKKAVAYAKEYKAQLDSVEPCWDRCALLAAKFGNLPLAQFNIETCHLDAESVNVLLPTLGASLKSTTDEQGGCWLSFLES
eukprot:3180075-Amphidinium_carterae.2